MMLAPAETFRSIGLAAAIVGTWEAVEHVERRVELKVWWRWVELLLRSAERMVNSGKGEAEMMSSPRERVEASEELILPPGLDAAPRAVRRAGPPAPPAARPRSVAVGFTSFPAAATSLVRCWDRGAGGMGRASGPLLDEPPGKRGIIQIYISLFLPPAGIIW